MIPSAHIQHHYIFSSDAYDGPMRNPDWYVDAGVDPVLEIYKLYDRILGQVRCALPESRLMIATGLHQDPHPKVTYYWRLRHHERFLRKLAVPFTKVEPRMSRDFLITCANDADAKTAADILMSAVGEDGVALFEVDNRGHDLFVMLAFPNDIPESFTFSVGDRPLGGLREFVAFVALKNGQHNGIGYFVDTNVAKGVDAPEFPLAELPNKIKAAFAA